MNISGDGYIHISQRARSDHISKRQDFKVLEGRGRKTSGQWLTCAAKSELWLNHHLTPNLKLSQCSSGKVSYLLWELWRRKWQPTLVFLPGETHGQRSLAGYGPRGHKVSDTTERLSLTWELSMILKDKHLANWWENLDYPPPKWLKMQQNNKDDVERQWRPWLECVGTAEISTSPRRKPTQMLLPNKTVRSPGSLSPGMYKTLLKERWDDISLSADRSIPKKWKF